tara:strand:- start:22 stop:387 length:366 start_codon:yes stop_codon:yes gene_type:complete
MGQIADALRSNLREIAQSDARSLRQIDEALKDARDAVGIHAITPTRDVKALLGKGSFQQQTVATLKGLCRQHNITGYSKLKKADIAKLLEKQGIEAPPRPLESFSKKELVALVRQLLGPEL